ncbi:MAG: DUF427 domain-containing protein [Enterobacter hormaechei]
MVSAIWKDTTIATSDETVIVEGNHYFPPSGVDLSLLEMSPHTSVCPIKGAARFFHVRAGDALRFCRINGGRSAKEALPVI